MKILLADDHQIFRESLRLLFDLEDDMEVVGEGSEGAEVLEALKSLETDIVLMDIAMNGMDGIEAAGKIKQMYPTIKVLMLSMNSERQNIMDALEAGVDGYLLKSAGKNEVLRAMRAVNEGSSYFSRQVSDEIVQQLSNQGKPKQKNKEGEKLSEREIEVLALIAKELSSAEIAERLFISVRTVDSHRRNMLEKLGLKNTAGLVRHAIENGII